MKDEHLSILTKKLDAAIRQSYPPIWMVVIGGSCLALLLPSIILIWCISQLKG